MSDRTSLLPAWVVEELRRPVRARTGAADRIMDRVRTAPMPERSRVLSLSALRPGMLRASVGFAAAASLAALIAGHAPESLAPFAGESGRASVAVIGDSIAGAIGEVRDTLRLVRFVLEAPGASRVALAGDFTAWAPAALERDKRGRWAATLALPAGVHAYAFVVDDTGRVDGPSVRTERLTIVPDVRAPEDSL